MLIYSNPRLAPVFFVHFSIGGPRTHSIENSDNWQKSEVDYVLYMAMRCTVDGCRSVSTRDAGRCRFCLRYRRSEIKNHNRSFDGIPDPKPSLPVWSFSSQMKTSRHRLIWAFQPPTPVSIAQQPPIKQFMRSMASNRLQITINSSSSNNNSQPVRWWLSTPKRAKCVQPPGDYILLWKFH